MSVIQVICSDEKPLVDTCEECNHMLKYESERKWPDVCPVCGKSTKELLKIMEEGFEIV